MVSMPLLSSQQCLEKREEVDGRVQVCAGYPEHMVCNGDSGGPLMCTNHKRRDQYFLTGIVSYGEKNCVADKPAVFTRVDSFLEWMAAVVQANTQT